jgi:alkylated DNA repair dioxygenase AlkB
VPTPIRISVVRSVTSVENFFNGVESKRKPPLAARLPATLPADFPKELVDELRFLPTFVGAPERLFEELLATVVWDTRLRSRKTASFGTPYNYSGLTYPEVPFPPAIAALAKQATAPLGFPPNNALLNFYAGDGGMGFHSDSSAALATDSGVGIVSLGAARELVFRRSGATYALLLPAGSLLRMSLAMQARWQHALPAGASETAARISVTFRRIVGD